MIEDKIKNSVILRKLLYFTIGLFTYPGLAIINKLKIEGTENIKNLPATNVLFVSNHQTYFADVMVFLHIFSAIKWRKKNKLGIPFYLLNPFTNVYFVAAEETMNGSFLSKIFKMGGALTVKRTWRTEGKEVKRERDETDTIKINEALKKSWVITFPQGTTKPFAPGRKGTAYIIRNSKPIVVPVIINGFWRAFNKKGLKFKKKNSVLKIKFEKPLVIDYTKPVDEILEIVMHAIKQSKEFMFRGKHLQKQLEDK